MVCRFLLSGQINVPSRNGKGSGGVQEEKEGEEGLYAGVIAPPG